MAEKHIYEIDELIEIVYGEEELEEMTDDDCEKIIELCWWHLGTCKLVDCIIDSCDLMRRDLE